MIFFYIPKVAEEKEFFCQVINFLKNFSSDFLKKALHSKIESLPEGKIICTPNGKGYKWYRSDGHKSVYIPKSERKLAEQLAIKKYLQQIEVDCIQEKQAIDFYLRHHNNMHPSTAQVQAHR